MASSSYDLLIRAGRVLCPRTGLDTTGEVATRGDRIVAVGAEISGNASHTIDAPEAVLLPGLIDLHAHPAVDGSKYGVDPDAEILPRGVTTVLSQGDAGADNWQRYRETTISPSRTRVIMALNLSAAGESMPGGCFENLDWVDVDRCVKTVQTAGIDIWGIAVNTSEIACGSTDPKTVMQRALEAAEQTGLPLLYGMRSPLLWSIDEQMEMLRPGDVVTYCFRQEPFGVVQNGKIPRSVQVARTRGVLFDIGHGMQSFDFTVAEAALSAGFPPDTISSDQYARHIGSRPQHDLLRTLSKLIAAGMPELNAFAAVTYRPAAILGMEDEIGSLSVGSCADLTLIKINEDAAPLKDVLGEERPGGCWEAHLTVRGGEVVTV